MVLLLAKNSKAGCLFRSNFLKQVVVEIQKMEHPGQKFSKYPPGKKPEELESELDHFDAANSYPTSPFKGRIVHSLSSGKVEMFLSAAYHAFTPYVNAWKR